jgi:hypothetical protein
MGYVIAAILVVLIVAAGIAFFVRGAARRSNVSEVDNPRGGPEHEARPDVARPVVGGEGEGTRSV